jgi:hypothetical protein
MFSDRKLLAESKKIPRLEIEVSSLLNAAPDDVHDDLINRYLDNDHKALAALSRSCRTLHSIYQPALSQRQLLQALIDDKKILSKRC